MGELILTFGLGALTGLSMSYAYVTVSYRRTWEATVSAQDDYLGEVLRLVEDERDFRVKIVNELAALQAQPTARRVL